MAKATNYTPEMEAILLEGYDPKASEAERLESVINLADAVGRSVASVRQKLVGLGVYVKPEKKAKDGSPIVSKAAMVSQIAGYCNADAEDFDSLEKATKNVLKALIATLRENAEESEE